MNSKEYVDQLNHLAFDELDEAMRQYANENSVPIIQDEGLAMLCQLVKIAQPSHILEIGTAIGYSAIQMAKHSNAKITSIEIDEKSYQIALANIEKAGLKNRITVIHCDALNCDFTQPIDFLFIDAAKAQYRRFFEKYTPLLKMGGVVFTDNLLFHDLVTTPEIESRSLRGLVRKIRDYNSWLMENNEFDSYMYQIGDGIAISIKK